MTAEHEHEEPPEVIATERLIRRVIRPTRPSLIVVEGTRMLDPPEQYDQCSVAGCDLWPVVIKHEQYHHARAVMAFCIEHAAAFGLDTGA